MELYGSNDGFLRDSGRTRRGPPKALRVSDVSGDDTRLFGACDVADTRSERGPMARAETPDAPILKIDPQDRKKVKGVKAGARAHAPATSETISQILPSPPGLASSSRGPNLRFSQDFHLYPTDVTRVPPLPPSQRVISSSTSRRPEPSQTRAPWARRPPPRRRGRRARLRAATPSG